MKEAYKKCMKEKNTIKIKSYESPCGVLLLGSFGGKLCVTGRWKNTAIV